MTPVEVGQLTYYQYVMLLMAAGEKGLENMRTAAKQLVETPKARAVREYYKKRGIKAQ